VRILELRHVDDARLRQLCLGDRTILLFGSAVSMWEPTGAPAGQDVARSLYHLLYGSPGDADPAMVPSEQAFEAVPFEVILEACPDANAVKRAVRSLYRDAHPNDLHLAIARALGAGTLQAVVTPNYDCALEEALAAEGVSATRVVKEPDVRLAMRDSPIYFKVHGTTDDEDPAQLVVALRDEARLPAWKAELLGRIVGARTLLVVGYSGRDFELCPALLAARPARVIWNDRHARPSPNALAVLRELDGVVLMGDMRSLFHRLFGTSEVLEPGTPAHGVASAFQAEVGAEALTPWAARLLNQMGYARGAERLSRTAPAGPGSALALGREHAQALMTGGRYRGAAREWLRLACHLPAGSEERVGCELQAADGWRSYGRWDLALAGLTGASWRSKRRASPHMRAIIGYKVLDFACTAGEVLGLIGAHRWVRPLGRWLGPLWDRTEARFLDAGDWMGVRIAGMLQARLAALGWLPSGARRPVIGAVEGFEHLAFVLGRSMALRWSVRTGEVDIDAVRPQVEELAVSTERLGISTEAWKLRRLLGAPWGAPEVQRNYRACEYAAWMKLLHAQGLGSYRFRR